MSENEKPTEEEVEQAKKVMVKILPIAREMHAEYQAKRAKAAILRQAILAWSEANRPKGSWAADELARENALDRVCGIARASVSESLAAALMFAGCRLAMDALKTDGEEGAEATFDRLKRDLELSAGTSGTGTAQKEGGQA